ncbi:hypothetical protein [Haliea sp.]|jgi:hypothetical protein|uniref:hypothetical protein n=1 Tax=Haliea sp. TaxID=1932666 RepID=UPI000C3BF563|nr:hypothetical protein [Haliea sp.]MAD65673.1 hypothetical protein [Haliea sp.]|tara:strand:+ start:6855 stop:7676 length:822 start_codon:yes stop_codon:yes gene_type:complete
MPEANTVEYKGYSLIKTPYFVQVWSSQSYRAGVGTIEEGKAYVDKQIKERLLKLIDIELIVMADAALSSIFDVPNECPSYHPLSDEAYTAGTDYFYLRSEASTPHERDVVNAIDGLLNETLTFEWGVSEEQDAAQFNSACNLESDTDYFYEEYVNTQKELKQRELESLKLATLELIPNAKEIKHYDHLAGLTEQQLKHLFTIEEIEVNEMESVDDYIEGRTSGHHRDVLDILDNALAKRPRDGGLGTVHMDEQGWLAFDIGERFLSAEIQRDL